MPELPDVTIYVEALEKRLVGQRLTALRLISPFVLRTYEPQISRFEGLRVVGLRRMGKRIVLSFEGDLHLVIHLMIAGRFQWKLRGAKAPGRITLAAFEFENGTLFFTEAGTKKRASLHAVEGEAGLSTFERAGIEVLECSFEAFSRALTRERHTLKRALTDPDILSGIGNAYSDEILHRARLSPFKRTDQASEEELKRLYEAMKAVLTEWIERLRNEAKDAFPTKVTAFREGMAVHGRFGEPCPDCGTPVQRIRYAENEANYCPECQTGGKLLADRSLSLLMKDWPKTLDELEQRKVKLRDG